MCCCAARANEQGEGLPPGAPCGVACGQALQPCGLTGGLPTASRLRRACTPFLIEKFPSTGKQITIRALSRAHSPGGRSTYLSGKAVQTNRATSISTSMIRSLIDCQRSVEELRGYSISFGSANDRSEVWIYFCLLTLDDSILEPGIFSPRMPAMETN